MERDKELLEIHMLGFYEELDGLKSTHQFFDRLELNAYNLGRNDAYCGDDITSLDYRSDLEILNKIKQY